MAIGGNVTVKVSSHWANRVDKKCDLRVAAILTVLIMHGIVWPMPRSYTRSPLYVKPHFAPKTDKRKVRAAPNPATSTTGQAIPPTR